MRRLNADARRHGHPEGRTLSEVLSKDGIDRSLRRISHEILERNASSLTDLALVGVLTRGAPLAQRVAQNIEHFEGLEVPVGSLDITMHRDDREARGKEPRYNAHPAQVFMGDTGALAIGGVLAAAAVLTKTEMLLPVIGGLFVLEGLSVIIQYFFFS